MTHFLQQIINFEIHLQYSLLAAFVMQRDNEGSGCRWCNIEVDIRTPKTTLWARISGARRKNGERQTDYQAHYSQR